MTNLFGNFFINFFRSRWVWTFFAAVVIAVLVWVIGPVIGIGAAHPLDNTFIRIAVVVGIFVLWVVWNLIQTIRGPRWTRRTRSASAPAPRRSRWSATG
jgi:type VI protein secretion system component VasK